MYLDTISITSYKLGEVIYLVYLYFALKIDGISINLHHGSQ